MKKRSLILWTLMLMSVVGQETNPAENPVPTPPAPPAVVLRPVTEAVPERDLSTSIAEVLKKPEFAWRLPRVIEKDKEQGIVSGFLRSAWKWFKSHLRPVKNWLHPYWEKFTHWLKEWMDKQSQAKDEEDSPVDWIMVTRRVLVLAAAVSLLAFLYVVWKRWNRSRRPVEAAQSIPVVAVPNLEDESVVAADLPADEWMDLARQLMNDGKARLASRAVYLGTLALLERHQIIRSTKSKSNGDYYREAERRSSGRTEITSLLGQNIRLFERGWYGTHEVTADHVETLTINRERLKGCLE